jgi:hypothetical protein
MLNTPLAVPLTTVSTSNATVVRSRIKELCRRRVPDGIFHRSHSSIPHLHSHSIVPGGFEVMS